MDDRAEYCMRLQEQMESNRSIFDAQWREVAELVRPNSNTFQQPIRPEGDKRNQRLFDATAMLALPKFAASTIAFTMPATQVWHKLTVMDDRLAENKNVKQYLEAVNKHLFKVRYSPQANFQSQSGEVVLDIGAFGTGVLFIDDLTGVGIRYKSYPRAEVYIAEDEHGRVNRLHRKFQLTAYQAVAKFGNSVSEGIRNAYEKTPLAKFWFLHCVGPNEEYDARAMLHPVKGKRFSSCYIEYEKRKTVDEGGYRVFPFAVPRHETASGEADGRSPAMNVLPAIRTLNEMKKTVLRAGQMVVAPPIMLTDDASLQAFNMRSNALNHGYLGSSGEPLAKAFETKGRVDIGIDLMNQEREAINDAFYVTLFRILVEEPQITATEAMLRAQEKGQLLAQPMGRMQSEMGGATVEREIDILAAAGVLPPMPRELMEAGGQFRIEYEAPLNQAQKAGAGVAIMQSIQAIAPLAQVDPSVMLIVDTEKAARMLFDVNGAPASILRSDEDVTALKEAKAQQAAEREMLAAAPVAAQAAKDMASAQSMAASSPNQAVPNLFPT